jgi:alpha-aminoadipic semialdehyde synthase
MKVVIGIRREDKNLWERRAPLTPDQVESLIRAHGIEVRVQPSAGSAP